MDQLIKNYILEHEEDINNNNWDNFFNGNSPDFSFQLAETLDAAEVLWRPFVTYMRKGFIHNNVSKYTIPDNIQKIGVNSIPPSIKEITLPKSIKKIRPTAFDSSTISELNYEGTIEDWKKIDRPIYWAFMEKIHCKDGDIIIEDGEDTSVNE